MGCSMGARLSRHNREPLLSSVLMHRARDLPGKLSQKSRGDINSRCATLVPRRDAWGYWSIANDVAHRSRHGPHHLVMSYLEDRRKGVSHSCRCKAGASWMRHRRSARCWRITSRIERGAPSPPGHPNRCVTQSRITWRITRPASGWTGQMTGRASAPRADPPLALVHQPGGGAPTEVTPHATLDGRRNQNPSCP